jgi:integrase
LRCLVTFAYKSGWRVSEVTGLKWNQVDLDVGVVRLETGETKNDDARTVYLDEELKLMLENVWKNRKKAEKLLPFVFTNSLGTDKVKRFDKAWKTACEKAGAGNKLFHDLRRTAVRNMVRAGVSETVAMKISGHRTRSVFDRYNITNDADLIEAARRQEIYLESRLGTVLGTVHHLDEKRANAVQH